jgi:hypothetical protein
MKIRLPTAGLLFAMVACTTEYAPPAVPGGGRDAGGGLQATALASLSLSEAPAPTRTFFWGEIDLAAPGFVGPPRDTLTLALDADNNLRYLSWKTLPMLPKTYGDGPTDFPLSGTRQVDLRPDYGLVFDEVSVIDSPAPTPTHFLLRTRLVSTASKCDFVEATEGERVVDGWAVTYTEEGTLYGASISAHASGALFAGDPTASAAASGQASLWSAPIELTAPGFYGPPVDHLTVALDGSGQIQSFSFEKFVQKVTFGTGSQDLPVAGKVTVGESTITVDAAVPATPTHFVLRYHVESQTQLSDYIEGIDGTREGNELVVRYFISGTLWGAPIDAHAAGALVPASPSSTP